MADSPARLLIHTTALSDNWAGFAGFIAGPLQEAAKNAGKNPDQLIRIPQAPQDYPVETVLWAVWGYITGQELGGNIWDLQPLRDRNDLTADDRTLARQDIAKYLIEQAQEWQDADRVSNPAEKRAEILLEIINAIANWQPPNAATVGQDDGLKLIEATLVRQEIPLATVWDKLTPLLSGYQTAQQTTFVFEDLDANVRAAFTDTRATIAGLKEENRSIPPELAGQWEAAQSAWQDSQQQWNELREPLTKLESEFLKDTPDNDLQDLLEVLTKTNFRTEKPSVTLLRQAMANALQRRFLAKRSSGGELGFAEQTAIERQVETWLEQLNKLADALAKPGITEFAARRNDLIKSTNAALAQLLGIELAQEDTGGGTPDDTEPTDETEEPKPEDETDKPPSDEDQPTQPPTEQEELTSAQQPTSRLLDTLPATPEGAPSQRTPIAQLGELASIQALLVRESERELARRIKTAFPDLPETELQNILNAQNSTLAMMVWQEFLQHGGLTRGSEVSFTELAEIWLKSTDLVWTQIQLERGTLGANPALFAQALDTSSPEDQTAIQAERAQLQKLLAELGYPPDQLSAFFRDTLQPQAMAQLLSTARKLKDPAEGNKILSQLFTGDPELNALRLRSLQSNPTLAMMPDNLTDDQFLDFMALMRKQEQGQELSFQEYQQLLSLLQILLPTLQLFRQDAKGINEIIAVLQGADSLNEYAQQAAKTAPMHRQFTLRSSFPPASPVARGLQLAANKQDADAADRAFGESPDEYTAQNGRGNVMLYAVLGQELLAQQNGTLDPQRAYILDEIIFNYVHGTGVLDAQTIALLQAPTPEITAEQNAAMAASGFLGAAALAQAQQADAAEVAANRPPEQLEKAFTARKLASLLAKTRGNPYAMAAQVGMELMNNPEARKELIKKLGLGLAVGAGAAGTAMYAMLLPWLKLIKALWPAIKLAAGAVNVVASVGSFIGNAASSIWGFITNPFGIFGGSAASTAATVTSTAAGSGVTAAGLGGPTAGSFATGASKEATAAAVEGAKSGVSNLKIAASDVAQRVGELGSKFATEAGTVTQTTLTAITTTTTLTAGITAAFILTPVVLLTLLTLIVLSAIGGTYNDNPTAGSGPSAAGSYCFEGEDRVAQSAKAISSRLQPGWWRYYNRHPDFPELFNTVMYNQYVSRYGATGVSSGGLSEPDYYIVQRTSTSIQTDLFWCTWLVVQSFRANGIQFPAYIFVPKMLASFPVGPVVKNKPNLNADNRLKNVLPNAIQAKDIPLGAVIFFGKPGGTFNAGNGGPGNAHVAIVCDIQFDDAAKTTGTLTSCDSNNASILNTYNIINGTVQDTATLTVDYFGIPNQSGGSCAAPADDASENGSPEQTAPPTETNPTGV